MLTVVYEIYSQDLPDRTTSVRGIDRDGRTVTLELVPTSRKPYTCPRCRGTVELASEHVVASYGVALAPGGPSHVHMHRGCAQELLLELRQLETVASARRAGAPKRSGKRRRRRG